MDIVCTWRRKNDGNIHKQTIKSNFWTSNKWWSFTRLNLRLKITVTINVQATKRKKKKLFVKRFPHMDLESKSVSEFELSRLSLKQRENSFYLWSFFYRHRRSFPFRKRSLPFSRHVENFWPVIESVPIRKKENRNPELNPHTSASPNLSPLPLHYQNEPPKFRKNYKYKLANCFS